MAGFKSLKLSLKSRPCVQQSQVETSMVSVERIQEYQDDLDHEAPYLIPEQDPGEGWPEYGEVRKKGCALFYDT